MGSKLETKQMEVLSFNIWAGGAREIWRCAVESNQQRLVGTHPKQQHGGGRHHLNLPHNQVGTHPKQQHGGGRHHLNLPHHQVGTHPRQQHGGGRHHLNLPHHQDQWS